MSHFQKSSLPGIISLSLSLSLSFSAALSLSLYIYIYLYISGEQCDSQGRVRGAVGRSSPHLAAAAGAEFDASSPPISGVWVTLTLVTRRAVCCCTRWHWSHHVEMLISITYISSHGYGTQTKRKMLIERIQKRNEKKRK